MSSYAVVQLLLCVLVPIVTVSILCQKARQRGAVPGWKLSIWASLLTTVLMTLHAYLFGDLHVHLPEVLILFMLPVGFVWGLLPAILTLVILRR